jgi:hypothetical protein
VSVEELTTLAQEFIDDPTEGFPVSGDMLTKDSHYRNALSGVIVTVDGLLVGGTK